MDLSSSSKNGERRIAVLGSNSFSGADFVDLLLDDPQNIVYGISRSPEKTPLFLPYLSREHARFTFVQADLNHDTPAILAALDGFEPQYIVNFAAQSEVAPSWDYPEHWFQTNVVALAALIKELRKRAYLKRYMHISSPEVYGSCEGNIDETARMNPSTPYAASKAAADFLLSTFQKNYDFPLVTIRATNVYGAHQQLFKIIPRSAIYMKLGKKIQLHGGGVAVKSYINIRDVSLGEYAALLHGTTGEMYHLSPDAGVAVADVVRTIASELGMKFEDCCEIVPERLGQDAAYLIDSAKARAQFSWRPQISLTEGIRSVIVWINRYWSEINREPLEYLHKP